MPKSAAGCWTCRVRHKRCDEMRPKCGGCSDLGISCYYGQVKPQWMDGGERQYKMAQRFKGEVRCTRDSRRGRRLGEKILGSVKAQSSRESCLNGCTPSANQSGSMVGPNALGQSGILDSSVLPKNMATTKQVRSSSESDASTAFGQHRNGHTALYRDESRLVRRDDFSLEFIMAYLDYVFPVMFPVYTPSILEGGRSWLLVLPLKHEALYHIITSLASYFFSIVPAVQDPAFALCAAQIKDGLQQQLGLAIENIQGHLHQFGNRVDPSDLTGNTILFVTIVHLMILEAITTKGRRWQMHLDAALVLFRHIYDSHTKRCNQSVWTSIFTRKGCSTDSQTEPQFPVWDCDQAALQFATTALVVYDIISSTSLERSPKLSQYHEGILASHEEKEGKARGVLLELEHFVGCQTWAMQLIGEITSLEVWKKAEDHRGELPTGKLIERGDVIEQKLVAGLARLDASDGRGKGHFRPHWKLDSVLFRSGHSKASLLGTMTRIWALAAQLYLRTVLYGSQRITPEARGIIVRTINLFDILASEPVQLRTLAWPFCVVGCLVEKSDEQAMRDIFHSMGPLGAFGTMSTALQIMENVWQRRSQHLQNSLDLGSFLGSLGYPVLLV